MEIISNIIELIASEVIPVEDGARRGDDFEIEIVEQHFVAHDRVIRVHPNDRGFEGSGGIAHLDNVGDLLVGINARLNGMKTQNSLNPGIREHIGECDTAKTLQMGMM